jgi:hypothetical protein
VQSRGKEVPTPSSETMQLPASSSAPTNEPIPLLKPLSLALHAFKASNTHHADAPRRRGGIIGPSQGPYHKTGQQTTGLGDGPCIIMTWLWDEQEAGFNSL